MKASITGRHVDISDDFRDYVNEKVGRLSRFYNRIHEVEVIVQRESEQFSVEVIVRAGHKHTFVANETGPDALALVDLVSDKIERQLKKQKEKETSHNNKDTAPHAGE